ncbi:unnamed protein product [Sphagnum jensenii]|uniref:Secreted protein n=1 Tax=Sphagnum jensenii TaxID=128206 RepID=A0ABP1ADQ8_9BRYO
MPNVFAFCSGLLPISGITDVILLFRHSLREYAVLQSIVVLPDILIACIFSCESGDRSSCRSRAIASFVWHHELDSLSVRSHTLRGIIASVFRRGDEPPV